MIRTMQRHFHRRSTEEARDRVRSYSTDEATEVRYMNLKELAQGPQSGTPWNED